MNKGKAAFANGLSERVAQDADGRRTLVADRTLSIKDDNHLLGVLNQRAKPLFTCAECFAGLDEVGNISA